MSKSQLEAGEEFRAAWRELGHALLDSALGRLLQRVVERLSSR